MKRYEEYKDSGVEWIGEIPEGWEVVKLGYIFDFKRGLNITKDDLVDTGIPCISYGEIHSKYGFEIIPEIHDLKCVDEVYLKTSNNSLLRRGDFIFADTSEDIKGSGNFTHLNSDTNIFAGYHSIIARLIVEHKCKYRYLAYLFDSQLFRSQIQSRVSGIKVFSITQTILKNVKVLLPTIYQQEKISIFLDNLICKIDILISDKQKLINLLKEKRQAIISEAVTKGLDKNVKMKDSGVEWIGEVPEGWSIKQFQHIIYNAANSMVDGPFGSDMKNEEYVDFGIPIIQLNNIGIGEHKLDKLNYITEKKAEDLKRHKAYAGEIVMAKMADPVARATIISNEYEQYILSADCIKVKVSANINPNFVVYCLNSYIKTEAELLSTGTTRIRINLSIAKKLHIIIPPLSIQNEIIEYLDLQSLNIYNLITDIQLQIKKLKEYRQSLISEVVTGKVAM